MAKIDEIFEILNVSQLVYFKTHKKSETNFVKSVEISVQKGRQV